MTASSRLLLTGASGYVGQHVLRRLLARGHQVRICVREPSERQDGAEQVTVRDLRDFSNPRVLTEGCAAVIHLAGRAHVFAEKERDPDAAYRSNNLDVTRRLAQAASETGVSRFIFASSAKVYGEGSDLALGERSNLTPLDSYGRSKLDAERALLAVCERSEMEFTVIRSPMVYGPSCKGNIRRLARLIRSRVPLPFGSVANRRSVISVDNLADIFVRCFVHAGARNEVFSVSDGPPVSTRSIVSALAEGLGVTPRLVGVSPALLSIAASGLGFAAEIRRLTGSFELDVSHVRSALQWEPVEPTVEALRRTGESFRSVAARGKVEA